MKDCATCGSPLPIVDESQKAAPSTAKEPVKQKPKNKEVIKVRAKVNSNKTKNTKGKGGSSNQTAEKPKKDKQPVASTPAPAPTNPPVEAAPVDSATESAPAEAVASAPETQAVPAPAETLATPPVAETAPAPVTPVESVPVVPAPVEQQPVTPAAEQAASPVVEQPTPVPEANPITDQQPAERQIEIDAEPETTHDIPITDNREGAEIAQPVEQPAEQPVEQPVVGAEATNETPPLTTDAPPVVENQNPVTGEMPATEPAEQPAYNPDADLPEAGEIEAADEESPWLAITVIIIVLVLVSSGIAYAISKYSSSGEGDDPSSIVTSVSEPSTITVIPGSTEVENVTATPKGKDGFVISWNVPADLSAMGIKVTVTNIGLGTITKDIDLSGTASEATINQLSPGTEYEVRVQVSGANGSLSTGKTVKVNPKGDERSPSERDSQRRSDLNKVAEALEGYYQKNEKYPSSTTYLALMSRLKSDGLLAAPLNDPESPGKSYIYTVATDRQSFTLSANLEESANDAVNGVLEIKSIEHVPDTIIPDDPFGDAVISSVPSSLVGVMPLKVTFKVDGLKNKDTFVAWKFGDSKNATGSPSTHTYESVGNYTVVATLKLGNETKEISAPVTVLAVGTTDAPGFTDADGDGLSDVQEREYGTNTNMKDTDYDGFTDKEEVNGGFDPLDTYITDSDGDGIMNDVEIREYGTNPFDADTDGDGYADWTEIQNNYDPLVYNRK
jgi:hypothetical protein